MMLFIVICLLSEGTEGVSVPQPVVLPPPVSHLRVITAEQRIPAIFTVKTLNGQALSPNFGDPRSHRRPPYPTRLIFEESSLPSEPDIPDYPLRIQRQPDVAYRRPSPPRPAADYYVPPQRPSNTPEFSASEEVSPGGFPPSLQNPRFEFGFVPLTSNKVVQSLSNTSSTHRNVTTFQSNATSALGFRPLYTDLPKNDIGYSQTEILATQKESNRNFSCGGRVDLNWCDLGRNYPRVDIQHLLSRCTNLMGKLYVEIPDNSNGLTVTGENKLLDLITAAGERRNTNPWSWSSYNHEGQLCEGQKSFAKPELAKDTKGKWYIIVQTANYVQRVPVETCKNIGQSCAKLSSCGVKSRCVQKYSYNFLISVDPQNFSDCPFMRLYKFPSICTCQVINNS